ncbi:MAG: rod shape-determining protein RodA [Kiritimatiellia bacterium]
MAKFLSFENPLFRIDWLALAVTLLLLGTGLTFIASAGYGNETIPLLQRQWFRQLLFILISIPVYCGATLFDYRWLKDAIGIVYAGCFLLLAGVLIFGKTINNSTSWYDLKIVDFQPSEVVKIGLVITLAAYLGDPLRNTRHPRIVLLPLVLTGILFLLILKQPDLGTAMILPCVVLTLLFVAGLSWRMLGLLLLLGVMSLPLAWGLAKDYQKDRILVFLNPDRDPLNASWNMKQSKMAVGSGGLRGKGIGQGTQNLLGFLPNTVAPTDFIFSVIAEEKGFFGSAGLLGLYSLLFGCLARTAVRACDMFGRLIAVGILTMLSVHVTINVAMTIGLMPIVGLPLPLVSYGGSFVVSMMLALGLVQSVHIRRS